MITRNLYLSIILLIILSSCGLYDYPYLNAPNVTVSDGNNICYIYNRTDNIDQFRGYELYYKIYNSDFFLTERSNDYENIFQTENPEPDDLISLGFKRVNTVLDTDNKTPKPMIPVDLADRKRAFKMKLHFENISAADQLNGYAEYTDGDETLISTYSDIYLYRAVNEYVSLGEYEYKTFKKEDLETGDSDLPSATNYILTLFVFSYGLDDSVYNIYSKPVYLGRFDY